MRLLSSDEWAQLRDLRLTALQESPESFLSTFEGQVGWSDADWRAEASRGDWLVETVDGQPVAMLGATAETDIADSERYLSYLWVAPAHRRRGLAAGLVRAMLDRLRATGVKRAWLWVLGENDIARALYEKLGFVSTGERQPLEKDPSRFEERMSLSLG